MNTAGFSRLTSPQFLQRENKIKIPKKENKYYNIFLTKTQNIPLFRFSEFLTHSTIFGSAFFFLAKYTQKVKSIKIVIKKFKSIEINCLLELNERDVIIKK